MTRVSRRGQVLQVDVVIEDADEDAAALFGARASARKVHAWIAKRVRAYLTDEAHARVGWAAWCRVNEAKIAAFFAGDDGDYCRCDLPERGFVALRWRRLR